MTRILIVSYFEFANYLNLQNPLQQTISHLLPCMSLLPEQKHFFFNKLSCNKTLVERYNDFYLSVLLVLKAFILQLMLFG